MTEAVAVVELDDREAVPHAAEKFVYGSGHVNVPRLNNRARDWPFPPDTDCLARQVLEGYIRNSQFQIVPGSKPNVHVPVLPRSPSIILNPRSSTDVTVKALPPLRSRG